MDSIQIARVSSFWLLPWHGCLVFEYVEDLVWQKVRKFVFLYMVAVDGGFYGWKEIILYES